MVRIGALLAVFGLPGMAQAQTVQTCVTRAEAQNLMQFVLPDVITGMRDKCGKTLPATAYLPKSGGVLAQRYKPGAAQAWPKAKPIALRLAGDMAKLLASMPDEAMKTLAGSFVGTAVAKEVPSENCGSIDRVMEAVAPLPPENMARLMVTLMEMQGQMSKPATGQPPAALKICSIEPVSPTLSPASK